MDVTLEKLDKRVPKVQRMACHANLSGKRTEMEQPFRGVLHPYESIFPFTPNRDLSGHGSFFLF